MREARRLISSGAIHGFKLHRPLQQFHANDHIAYPFYEVLAEARLPVTFSHRAQRYRHRHARWRGRAIVKYANPMDVDDMAVHFRICRSSWRTRRSHAGRGDFGLHAQAASVHRSFGMVAQILFANLNPVRQYFAKAQNAFRLGLSAGSPPIAGWLTLPSQQQIAYVRAMETANIE